MGDGRGQLAGRLRMPTLASIKMENQCQQYKLIQTLKRVLPLKRERK